MFPPQHLWPARACARRWRAALITNLSPAGSPAANPEITGRSGQFAGAICNFWVAIPKNCTAKSVGPPNMKCN